MSDYREIAAHADSAAPSEGAFPHSPSSCASLSLQHLFLWQKQNKNLKINGVDLAAHFHIKRSKNKANPGRPFLCVQYVFVLLMTDFGKS